VKDEAMQDYQMPTVYTRMMDDHAAADYIADQRRYAPVTASATTHYADATGRVLLGERTIADAQRVADEAAGGLVALLLNRGR
jgi:hypothetical protein